MINALSFDIEEWFCVSNFAPYIRREDWPNLESRVHNQTGLILRILNKYKTKATFFILGWVAQKYPELVKMIYQQGHEIATHGFSHKFLCQMSPDEFRQDLKKSIDILKDITGAKIIGHRACSFSLTPNTLWALDIMLDLGLEYDSSFYRVGSFKKFPRRPFRIRQIQQNYIVEFPLTTMRFLLWDIRV